MTGPIRCVARGIAVLGMVLPGACGGGDATSAQDAASNGGFVVAWTGTPAAWPGDLGDGIVLERATLAVDTLRIVGDAAPGDPRTTSGERIVEWTDNGAPAPLELPDAPGGLYSQLSLLVDGHVAGPSIELRGHAMVDAVDREYRIVDDSPFSITLDLHTTLTPPTPVQIALTFDFAAAVEAVDFDAFADTGERLELTTGNAEMTVFRTKLSQGIQASATRSSNAL